MDTQNIQEIQKLILNDLNAYKKFNNVNLITILNNKNEYNKKLYDKLMKYEEISIIDFFINSYLNKMNLINDKFNFVNYYNFLLIKYYKKSNIMNFYYEIKNYIKHIEDYNIIKKDNEKINSLLNEDNESIEKKNKLRQYHENI